MNVENVPVRTRPSKTRSRLKKRTMRINDDPGSKRRLRNTVKATRLPEKAGAFNAQQ